MIKLIISMILIINIYANPVVTTNLDTCIDTSKYQDKGFKQLKELLISKTQDIAFEEFAKQEIGRSPNIVLTKDHRKDLIVKVNDIYDDGDKLCNKSTVTIKEEKLKYYLPQKISLDRICHKDENLPPKRLKEAAELKSYKALIAEITDKSITNELAKKLIKNYSRTDGKMYMSKGAYCLGASGEVIPYEIDTGVITKVSNKNTEKITQSSTNNMQIVKNKAIIVINSSAGKQKSFEFDYTNDGIVLPKKAMKYMAIQNQKDHLVSSINIKLKVPDTIKTDMITIKSNGYLYRTSSYFGYTATINGLTDNDANSSFATEVINDGNLKYVNLSITIETDKDRASSDGYLSYIKKLSELTFSIDESNEKLIPFYIKNNIKQNLIINSSAGKQKSFEFDYTNDGIVLPKKAMKYMAIQNQKDHLVSSINIKLKVPDTIKTDMITIKSNGYLYRTSSYFGYTATINGLTDNDANSSFATEVINDGNLKYVNLSITIETDKDRASSDGYLFYICGYLARLSLIATDVDDGEKWYALTPIAPSKAIQLPAKITKDDKEKTLIKKDKHMIYNGISYQPSKELSQYIFLKSNKEDLLTNLTIKLKVPDTIKTDMITIKSNGYLNRTSSYFGYTATINGLTDNDANSSFATEVINDGNLKYVNLSITIETDKDRASSDGYLSYIYGYLARLSLIATDVDDGEKWYALTPINN